MVEALDRGLVSELYAGLNAIAADAFPRHCNTCGARFETAEEFLNQTEALRNTTGVRESYDDDDAPLVEVYRNCPCGSTLMEEFADRRDNSPAGVERRRVFDVLTARLVGAGFDQELATRELRKVLRGQPSVILPSGARSGRVPDPKSSP